MRNRRNTGSARPFDPATAPSSRALAIASFTAGALLLAGPAAARGVTFPKDKPKVVMDVPDDLIVAYTAFGLEITSPDKKLFIVADILPRNEAEAAAWAKTATAKMQTFGVKFNEPGGRSKAEPPRQAAAPNAEPTVTEPKAADLKAAVPQAAEPQKAPAPSASAAAAPAEAPAAIDRSAPTMTLMSPGIKPTAPDAPSPDPVPVFTGAPSLATPGRPNVKLAVRTDVPAGASIEEMAIPVPKSGPRKLPFKVGHFSHTTLDGEHIDVEIVNFTVSAKQLFLVLQASLSSDDRAAEIMRSVKPTS